MELITVIIPVFNHEKYVIESIESIVNQTYKNLEIIIVNDGSSDNSDATIKSYINNNPDDRIKYINLENNIGKWACLNYAISICSGTIITCHDADDVSLLNRIELQYFVLKNKEAIATMCGFYHCYSQEEIDWNKDSIVNVNDLQVFDKNEVLDGVIKYYNGGVKHFFVGIDVEPAGCSTMFYKNIWTFGLRFNAPNTGTRIRMSEDSDFNTRLCLLIGNVVIIKNKLYLYRRNTTTNTDQTK